MHFPYLKSNAFSVLWLKPYEIKSQALTFIVSRDAKISVLQFSQLAKIWILWWNGEVVALYYKVSMKNCFSAFVFGSVTRSALGYKRCVWGGNYTNGLILNRQSQKMWIKNLHIHFVKTAYIVINRTSILNLNRSQHEKYSYQYRRYTFLSLSVWDELSVLIR